MGVGVVGGQVQRYLADGGTVVPREATGHLVNSRPDVTEAVTVELLGLCAHTSYGKHLAILQHALLELAEKDAEA